MSEVGTGCVLGKGRTESKSQDQLVVVRASLKREQLFQDALSLTHDGGCRSPSSLRAAAATRVARVNSVQDRGTGRTVIL